MKKTLLICFAAFCSSSAFALDAPTQATAPQAENEAVAPNVNEPTAPWDKIECRAIDAWGRVFTASGHDWKSSRARELQNEAMDLCSQSSGLYNCRAMGCVYY